MVFSSALFLFIFFPVFFTIYFVTPNKFRNYVVLAGSIIFYAWGAPFFIGILLLSLLIDWQIVNAINNNKVNKELRRFYLVIAIIMNVGLLAYFKYSNFFVININIIFKYFGLNLITWSKVILPIGISFIVFHKISYIVDIYRQDKKPTEKLSIYIMYILLFPMAIAGPIIKFQNISEQLSYRTSKFEDVLYGLFRFSVGLFKKVWIADTVALLADPIFGLPKDQLSFWYAWIGIICYTLQIYYDFSGYADMAIGLSRMMGFKVGENFRYPYISQSISEFWRRWHISLSSWMRDYLYIPLGGNRRSKIRNNINLWVVFLISGLWHGANWTFVIWGALHGLFIVCDKLFWMKISKQLPKFINIIITFSFVLFAWVFFRSDTIAHAFNFLRTMFSFSSANNFIPVQSIIFSNSIVLILITSFIAAFIPALTVFDNVLYKYQYILNSEYFRMGIVIIMFVLSVPKCVTSSFSPFIYFRF